MRIGEQLVVDQPDVPLQHRSEELAVVGLFLDGVAEELVGLAGQQHVQWDLLHPQDQVAVRQVVHQGDLESLVFRIAISPYRAALHNQVHVGIAGHHFFALGRGERNATVGGLLALTDDADLSVSGGHGYTRLEREAKGRPLVPARSLILAVPLRGRWKAMRSFPWGRPGFDSGFVMCVSMPGVMCGPYPSASTP